MQIFDRDRLEIPLHQILFELAHLLHLAHQLERLLVAEALRPVKHMIVAIAEIFEIADIVVLGEQFVEVGLGLRVLELVAFELAQRLRKRRGRRWS